MSRTNPAELPFSAVLLSTGAEILFTADRHFGRTNASLQHLRRCH